MSKKKVVGYCGNAQIFKLGSGDPIPESMGIIRIDIDKLRKFTGGSLDILHGYIEFQAFKLNPENRKPFKTHSLKYIIDEL